MIFEQTRRSPDRQNRTARRRADVDEILGVFRAVFPELDFRILDRATAVNAQASILNGVRSVDLFGGFAYHPCIGHDALVFVLLHESGHHLSDGCRMKWNVSLACECSADFWAVTEGQARFKQGNYRFDIEEGLKQIELAAAPAGRRLSGRSNPKCEFLNWRRRKLRLIQSESFDRSVCAIV